MAAIFMGLGKDVDLEAGGGLRATRPPAAAVAAAVAARYWALAVAASALRRATFCWRLDSEAVEAIRKAWGTGVTWASRTEWAVAGLVIPQRA